MSRAYCVQLCLLVLLATSSASAQFSFPGYLPQQCAATASRSITGATDGQIVGILALGVALPVGTTDLNIGMSMDDGRSAAWIYLVNSPSLDTVAASPFIRLLGACTPPPLQGLDLGGFGDMGPVPTTPLPTTFIQGQELVGAVKGNVDYQRWAVAHPDSAPSLVILTVAEEDALGFPAGTPFWLFNWIPGGFGGGGGGGQPGAPFVCVVHAQNGQTICFGEDVTSVHEVANEGIVAIAPNPASDVATIQVPEAWVGRTVTVEAVNGTGRRLRLLSGTVGPHRQLMLSTESLSQGQWALCVSDGTHMITSLLSILR